MRLFGFDGGGSTSEAASLMGGEGNDLLAAQVVLVQEREDGHRQGVPPDGRSQKDDVIVIQVGQIRGKLRTGIVSLFGIGEIGQLPINSGIVVLFHHNPVNVAFGLFFDYFGHVLNGTILLAILDGDAGSGHSIHAGKRI